METDDEKTIDDYLVDTIIYNNSDKIDEDRKETIKKIKLESNFYIMFRNTFRIVINKKENLNIKKTLLDLILTPYKYDKKKQLIDYTKKMEIIIEEMKKILEEKSKYIKFNNFKN